MSAVHSITIAIASFLLFILIFIILFILFYIIIANDSKSIKLFWKLKILRLQVKIITL